MPEDDDARHRREEQERRAKRKASKISRSDAQLEKDRKRKEKRQEILRRVGAAAAGGRDGSSKRQKTTTEKPVTSSQFQELFAQRAQGFQIEFRFRNAPPRPPVGPCFVGNSLDAVLAEQARQYKPHNAVEANHTWRLHSDPDIGVPLAPSAMDLKSYKKPAEDVTVELHPDDEALLNWTGSMGDTAAEKLKRRREQARAAARLAASGQSPPPKAANVQRAPSAKKKAFSRVLKEDMQTWMKKTTYLSNDYSRKVHDFKSLAQTKSEVAADLQEKQDEMAVRRTVKAIRKSFVEKPLQHPTNKALKPKKIMQVLPNVDNWGRAFTHVVVDKAPTNLPEGHTIEDLTKAFITDVEKRQANARMTCKMLVPGKNDDDDDHGKNLYDPIQSYDLDVVPLKEEDAPHINFCLWVDKDKGVARYIPVASRVQLSTGRPVRVPVPCPVERRSMTDAERDEMEERMAEMDQDLAEKHHIDKKNNTGTTVPATSKPAAVEKGDDGEDDFGDDDSDSDEEEIFGGGPKKTITAES